MRLTGVVSAESSRLCATLPLPVHRRALLSHGGPLLCPLVRRQSACFAQGDCQVDAISSSSSPAIIEGFHGEARRSPAGSSAFAEPLVEHLVAEIASDLSWPDWVRHFVEVEALAYTQEELKIRLKDAVRSEKYCEAASLKLELSRVESMDVVAGVQSRLADALKEERYSDAVAIRDEGLASMQGWWSGCSEDDPVGHLLHVKAEYGRWTGRVYRARDLEDMYLRRGSPRTRVASALTPTTTAKTVGSPVMEIFLKESDSGGGSSSNGSKELIHQAVSLRIPTMYELEARRLSAGMDDAGSDCDSASERMGDSSKGGSASAASTSVVRLSVSVGLDGTTSIKAQLPQQASKKARGSSSSSSSTAREQVLKAMVTKALGISADSVEVQMVDESEEDDGLSSDEDEAVLYKLTGLDADVGRIEDEVLANQLKAWRRDAALDGDIGPVPVSDEIIDITAAMSSLDWEDGAGADVPPYVRSSNTAATGASMSRSAVSELADELAQEGAFSDLTRVPATLELMGRDRFVFQVLEDPTTEQHSGSASSSSSSYNSYPASPSGNGADGLLPIQGQSSDAAPIPFSLFDWKLSRTRGDAPSSDGASSASSSASEATTSDRGSESSFDVEIPVSRLLTQRSPASASSLSAAFDELAEHVAQLQEAKVGRSVPRQALADAMREITTRLVSGKQVSNVTMLHIGLPDAPEVPTLATAVTLLPPTQLPPAKEEATRFQYNRIPANLPNTDIFDGLYLGAFGPHGAEMLRLSRTTLDGEEVVSAVKITGDANVPMNQVSFRAKIGRKHRLDSKDVYPDQLGVVARYKGEGRVAQRGFRNSRWVEGELLVFSSGGSPFTGNAELGFVWAVPGEKRFLILLNKVDLKNCEK